MKLRSRGLFAASVLLGAAVVSACGPRQPWQSELVSVNAAGTDSGNSESIGAVFSPDGSTLAFASNASDLGPTDTNAAEDIYLRDLDSGTTTLMSTNAAGTDSGNSWSLSPVFSPDGTKVAFLSAASDLGATDSSNTIDLYVRDLASGTTTLVSVNAAGTDSGNGMSFSPAFSPDGTDLAFQSQASDLVPNDTNSASDVFLRDLASGTTTLVSVDADGTDSGDHWSDDPVFGPDGTTIAFTSYADDLGPTDTNGDPLADVYLRDLASGTTTLVSVNTAGTDSGSGGSSSGSLFSWDGTKLVFQSEASDLVPNDTNSASDVFVRDLASGTTTLVSVNAAGTDSGNGRSGADSYSGNEVRSLFSPDGTKVAFLSRASDLGPTDTNNSYDIYLRDLVLGTTSLVTVKAAGTDSALTNLVFGMAFSPDGTKIAFGAAASDLTLVGARPARESGSRYHDVFVRDLIHETTTLVSSDAAGTSAGNGDSGLAFAGYTGVGPAGVFSPDGRRIVFYSRASDLGPVDHDRPGGVAQDDDVYLATLRGADLTIDGDAEPDPVEPGGVVTYRFAVGNDGPDVADDTAVAVLLPEGTTVLDVETSQGECDGPGEEPPTLVVCELGGLPVDGAGEVTIRASVDAPAATQLTATAAVGSEPTADPAHSNNLAVVTSTVLRAS